jgi:hypothetical protein
MSKENRINFGIGQFHYNYKQIQRLIRNISAAKFEITKITFLIRPDQKQKQFTFVDQSDLG